MAQEDDPVDARQPSIQVISRAAAVMRALGNNPGGLSLSAMAKAVELPRSTIQRIVMALEEEHFVESMGPSGGFRLGPALGQLIHQTQADIITSVRASLTVLSQQVRESVCLGTLAGDKDYVVDCVIFERELRVVFPVGIQAPAYATAAGKVMLAELSDVSLGAVLPAILPVLTPATLDRTALLAQLQDIRLAKFAQDEEEHLEGICTFAVLLNTYLGTYAISIISPSSRATRHGTDYKAALLACKAEIESKIGSVPKAGALGR